MIFLSAALIGLAAGAGLWLLSLRHARTCTFCGSRKDLHPCNAVEWICWECAQCTFTITRWF